MENMIMVSLELFGIGVCALSGATQGIRHKLDLFGVVFLACCVGVGGGIIRDCIIGSLPVAALTNQRYILICLVVGLITFGSLRFWKNRFDSTILYCDAIALGVFTALGAQKASLLGLNETGIILSAMFTAIGGGVIRDLLVRTVPAVLCHDIYATASLIGAVLFCFIQPLQLPFWLLFIIVSFTVTGVRVWAIVYRIHLPKN